MFGHIISKPSDKLHRVITMEDSEDTEFVASEHDRLVSAVSKLDKTQYITAPTRNEPTNLNSEFNLIKRSQKLDLKNVVKVLGDTAGHVRISKKLSKSQEVSKVLPKPLEKPQVERIKRATGYAETKKKVGRWDPVVARSRTLDYVSFPLKHESTKLQPTHEFLSKLKSKSALERELEEVDAPVLENVEEEEEQLYPMSYEEMVEHRQHLAKLRAQESYRAAKAKRQSKIKSKKYHRVLKKEKLKQQLKEFEELQKTNPEEALKKLEVLEKSRALERHTLRHKNTGKWAKNKMIRAKYDKEARQQIAEQLAVSRGLTQKTQDKDSTDDEADGNENAPDIALSQDPMNPWMMQQKDKSNVNPEFDFEYKKYLMGKMFKCKDEDSDSDDNEKREDDSKEGLTSGNGLKVLKQGINKPVQEEHDGGSVEDSSENELIQDTKNNLSYENINEKLNKTKVNKKKGRDGIKTLKSEKTKGRFNIDSKGIKKRNKPVATSNWVVESITDEKEAVPTEEITSAFESLESKMAKKVEEKLKSIRKDIEILERVTKPKTNNKQQKHTDKPQTDNLEYLKLRNQKTKAIIDEELMETTTKTLPEMQIEEQSISKVLNTSVAPVQEFKDLNIDPNRFIEVKPKYLNNILPGKENDIDELDDDEQVVPRVTIEEVFEEDDVVASFRQEKDEEINQDKPEDINLTLPGWGAWGGKGVKAPKRKKNRFILKAPPKMPRRDENKGDIIIKEYTDPKLNAHKVKDLPYPFQSVKEFEASIRAPLGNTFIPEKAHKKLIRPSVITKAGTIIEPMDEEELLVKKNRIFKKEAIIKVVSK